MIRHRKTLIVIFALSLALILAANGCGQKQQAEIELAPESALPDFVQSQPDNVKLAYRYAIANPEHLSQFPCYCGCNAIDHKNNLDCYVKEIRADGTIEFDDHAFV